jgi:hypothetical protein
MLEMELKIGFQGVLTFATLQQTGTKISRRRKIYLKKNLQVAACSRMEDTFLLVKIFEKLVALLHVVTKR